MRDPPHMSTCVVVGAATPVGLALADDLADDHHLVAAIGDSSDRAMVERHYDELRETDPFSLEAMRDTLRGADVLACSVRPYRPEGGWTQSESSPLEMLVAANLAAAAEETSVQQLSVFLSAADLGGPLVGGSTLAEIVEVVEAASTPAITLFCDAVGGRGTLSFAVVDRISRRGSFLAPDWSRSERSFVRADDAATVMAAAVRERVDTNRRVRLVPPRRTTLVDTVRDAAARRGDELTIRRLPGDWPRTSTRWLANVTSHSIDRMRAFLALFRSDPPAPEGSVEERDVPNGGPSAVLPEVEETALVEREHSTAPIRVDSEPRIHSIQRLPYHIDWSADDLADEYFDWLGDAFWPVLRVERDRQRVRMFFRGIGVPMLDLSALPQSEARHRKTYRITGGALTTGARDSHFEFRPLPESRTLIVALRGYRTALPWLLYRWTQALAHRFVMYVFGRRLAHLAAREDASDK